VLEHALSIFNRLEAKIERVFCEKGKKIGKLEVLSPYGAILGLGLCNHCGAL
jgi:hypothetical protein